MSTPSARGGTYAERLYDMHCHLDFFEDPALIAEQAAQLELGILAVGVTPENYVELTGTLDERAGVRCAVGAHPSWIAGARGGTADVERACALIEHCRFVGEVGLDFSEKNMLPGAKEAQVAAFTQIGEACAQRGDCVVSIHAVRSASCALDILETTGAITNCSCIFHWFTGSSDELWRAIRAGAWFSVNERQLATKRGREYARLIPADKLLLESDLPAEDGSGARNAQDIVMSLEQTLTHLAECRNQDPAALRDILASNSEHLLNHS